MTTNVTDGTDGVTLYVAARDGVPLRLRTPRRAAHPTARHPDDLAARLLYHASPSSEPGPLPRVGVELEAGGRLILRYWRDYPSPPAPTGDVRSVTSVGVARRSLRHHEEIAFASKLLQDHGFDLVRVYDTACVDVYVR